MISAKLTIKERAIKTGTLMMQEDATFQRLGATLENIDKGSAIVRLEINHTHLNGHGFCHGGIIFTLADATFGFACNSYNIKAVAQNCNITYISPAKEKDVLFSEAHEIKKYGRSAIYDVTIRNSRENLVAIFRGHSRDIGNQIFEEV
ncbi:MAG: hydroxyphenylacetyl-CoA thioesterase PaaI [Paracoccaceae bacterium]|nr:hydroxyphenylacetyl-CoA thioesterase PaaI [Paracoccaceae bacterium]